MAEKIIVDVQNWPRREHYHYFGELDDPYFGITAKADFTSCYRQAKLDGESFFLYSLHKILRAVNAVEEFRYRIEDGRIVLYDLIGASPTIGREDGVDAENVSAETDEAGEIVDDYRQDQQAED